MPAARRPRPAHACLLGLLAALGAGCTRTVWVDLDATGCSDASVQVMNRDSDTVQRMAAVCAINGAPARAQGLRCHGKTLQVGCSGPGNPTSKVTP